VWDHDGVIVATTMLDRPSNTAFVLDQRANTASLPVMSISALFDSIEQWKRRVDVIFRTSSPLPKPLGKRYWMT
jgi:hypothetical protein